MRVATIDIGTNTVLLLVAQADADGTLHSVLEKATITRLGQGVDRSRRFAPEALSRTRACLEAYAETIGSLGVDAIAVAGTSAMRDASGGDELRERIRELFGVDVRVLSGREEGRLTFAGSLSGLSLDAPGDIAVFDVGGGSTEVVIGRRETESPSLAYVASFDVGSVRLTERHVRGDPPPPDEIARIRESARSVFVPVPMLPPDAPVVGIAGTVTTLAAVALRLESYDGARVHGHVLRRSDLEAVLRRLGSLDLQTRRSVPGMEPARADVILAGGAIVLALLEHWGAPAMVVSDRGVRWGLAEELRSRATHQLK